MSLVIAFTQTSHDSFTKSKLWYQIDLAHDPNSQYRAQKKRLTSFSIETLWVTSLQAYLGSSKIELENNLLGKKSFAGF